MGRIREGEREEINYAIQSYTSKQLAQVKDLHVIIKPANTRVIDKKCRPITGAS